MNPLATLRAFVSRADLQGGKKEDFMAKVLHPC